MGDGVPEITTASQGTSTAKEPGAASTHRGIRMSDNATRTDPGIARGGADTRRLLGDRLAGAADRMMHTAPNGWKGGMGADTHVVGFFVAC